MGVYDHFKDDEKQQAVERLRKAAEELGFYMKAEQFMIPPGMEEEEDPPVFLQVAFQVGERAFKPEMAAEAPEEMDEEQAAFNAQFADLVARATDPTVEIREQLAHGMRQGKGILDLDLGDDSEILDT